jgi:hypothetical protein
LSRNFFIPFWDGKSSFSWMRLRMCWCGWFMVGLSF